MKDVIAKKYAKAIVDFYGLDDIHVFLSYADNCYKSFNDPLFVDVINSPFVSLDIKENLLTELLGINDDKSKKVLSLIVKNQRMNILSAIMHELELVLANKNRKYKAVVSSSQKLDSTLVSSLSTLLSKKLDVELDTQEKLSDVDGVRVSIDGMDMEVLFSKNRLGALLKESIMKSI